MNKITELRGIIVWVRVLNICLQDFGVPLVDELEEESLVPVHLGLPQEARDHAIHHDKQVLRLGHLHLKAIEGLGVVLDFAVIYQRSDHSRVVPNYHLQPHYFVLALHLFKGIKPGELIYEFCKTLVEVEIVLQRKLFLLPHMVLPDGYNLLQ